ncbi:AmmeMemoRadiSam system protein B [Vibrio sp. SCSIO 43140]|uniref:AmmeMemoRadiSam system protein B n=1 Tax=Vibrio sp. SCSIO 43140 TaxID=2819100 RepID=UPI002074CEFE|nr:AmmeMemoRadiSam system protein B [Vibrio sp. SCSIO 43140]USD62437.1 AmmeMemoRadiSam system protein B [Vibrio sp. SCSIO 43140]
MDVRPTAVAGRFYYGDPNKLQTHISQLMASVSSEGKHHSEEAISGLIVPHAGYVFSGHTAAFGYQLLKEQNEQFSRVVIIGPSHRVAFSGCAIPSVKYFDTPLGKVPLDTQAIDKLSENDICTVNDLAHENEHCLEVQLPFLLRCLGGFSVVPILTGNVDMVSVAKLVETLWDTNTLLVVSSDLSHFHSYDDCVVLDNNSCSKIENGLPLTGHEACGHTSINAANLIINKRNRRLTRLSLTNSGDSPHGDKQRVVGYVSYAISR